MGAPRDAARAPQAASRLDTWEADTVVAPHLAGDRLVYTMNDAAGSYRRCSSLNRAAPFEP